MSEGSLPFNFDGPRTATDVVQDLREIARWHDTSEAHVFVDRPDGTQVRLRGFVTVEDQSTDGDLHVRVDGSEVFVFRPEAFREASLLTLDGADYYALIIETTSGRLHLKDAHNGL